MARLRKFAWVFIVIEVLAIILSQHRVVEDIAKGFGAVHAALGGWWFWSLVSAICLAWIIASMTRRRRRAAAAPAGEEADAA